MEDRNFVGTCELDLTKGTRLQGTYLSLDWTLMLQSDYRKDKRKIKHDHNDVDFGK